MSDLPSPREALFETTPEGLVRKDDGWFIVNARDAAWRVNEKFGAFCSFEGEMKFPHYGINLHVIQPGQPNCHYHGESAQEDFLVLSGECLVIIDGQERRLKQWDFVHCAPWTDHVFVGSGSGPCALLMVGARNLPEELRYPVNEIAKKHGASAQSFTTDPSVSYEGCPKSAPSKPVDW